MKRKLLVLLLVLPTLLFFVNASYAEDTISGFVAAGVAKPENIDATFYVIGGFRWAFRSTWAVEPTVGYWKAEDVERQCPGPNCASYDLRDLHAGASLLHLSAYKKVGLFLGGGAAAHFRERTANFPPGSPKSAAEPSDTRLGLHFLSGADFTLVSNVDLTASVRGNFVFRDEDRGVDLDNQFFWTAQAGIRVYFD